MMPNFALEDPETFSVVLPWSMVTRETTKGVQERLGSLEVPKNSAKLLQEKVRRGLISF